MQVIDWVLALVPLLVVLGVAVYTQRHMKGVTDFLSGGRLAERYLLAVARGELGAGLVGFVAGLEVMPRAGFTLLWWGWITAPITLIVAISGFVIYRYRETRAQTLGQFFEIRYSKQFRLFTGMLGFVAGLLNFGIIPAVGARFFVYFLGLPPAVTVYSHVIPTYIPLLGLFLSITAALALAGGLITVIMTNCIEGIISQILYLVVIVCLITMFRWPQIATVLEHRPPGQSLLNPFDSMGLKDFNLAYVLMTLFLTVYGTMAWQNQSSYNAASLTAHESRMGGILGGWRGMGKNAMGTLLAICAMTYLTHPDFAVQSAQAHQQITQIADLHIRQQVQLTVAMSHLLPAGVKGVVCTILLMGIFGGDSTHMHSWGSLLIQDVLVPLRKKAFNPRQHVRLLRLSITGVAVFAFLFGSLFRQTEYILMWWAVTMAVYVGGAGSVIIGGLYWKKGTTAGAWAALLAGSGLSLGGIVAREVYGDRFPLNGIQVSFYATLIAIAVYVAVSLITCKGDFNMELMLHRGQYAAIKPLVGEAVKPVRGRNVWLGKLIGFDQEFTLGDKWLAGSLFGWSVLWFLVFAIGSIWNFLAPWPVSVWSTFWHVVAIGLPIFFCLVTAVWFTWGGLRDMRAFFGRLRQEKVNPLDDGTVVDHQNLDEHVLVEEVEGAGEEVGEKEARIPLPT